MADFEVAKATIESMGEDLRLAQRFIRKAIKTAEEADLIETAADLQTPLTWLSVYTQEGGYLEHYTTQEP